MKTENSNPPGSETWTLDGYNFGSTTMKRNAASLAQLLARTIERMARADGQSEFYLSGDCIRVIAQTIASAQQDDSDCFAEVPETEHHGGKALP